MNIGLTFFAALRTLRTKIQALRCGSVLQHGKELHLGAGVRIWAPRHVVIGNQVYLGKDVHIEANCRIGNYCLLANRVAIVGRHDHDFTESGFPVRFSPWIGSKRFPNRYVEEEAVIEDDVWLGFSAIVLTGVIIGRGCIVAAGSVITKSVPPYSIVAGVPGKVVGRRFEGNVAVAEHEAAVREGLFRFSEKGFDFCQIEPGSKESAGTY